MDGFQALERLRRDVSMASLPVMVLTSETGAGVEKRVLEMGADDYVVKPFEARCADFPCSRHVQAARKSGRLTAPRIAEASRWN